MSVITNRRAFFDYQIGPDRFEAGIVLKGAEAKAVNMGRGDLSGSHIKVLNGEIFLVNGNIPIENAPLIEPKRSRKLLLKRQEITFLSGKLSQKGLNLVPLKMYTKGRLVKLEIGLGSLKRKFEKRESIKKRDISRQIKQELI